MPIKKSTSSKGSIATLEASQDKAFCMANGRRVTKLTDLLSVIESSDDGTFYHHVNNTKNDFANWIKDVFNNKTLASKISKAKSRNDLVSVLKTELK